MSAADNLSHLQFNLTVDRKAGNYHHLTATHPETGHELGYMEWGGDGAEPAGEIGRVFVNKDNRGSGIGAALYHEALSNKKVKLKPEHSSRRTDAGDAWARRVGGELPERIRIPSSSDL